MQPAIENEDVLKRVKSMVAELLEDDVPPIVICYALSYVSVDLGLMADPDARRVFSTLLATMARATERAVPDDWGRTQESLVPAGGTKQ